MARYATTEKQYQCKSCFSIMAWRDMRRELQTKHFVHHAYMHCPKCDKILVDLTSENYAFTRSCGPMKPVRG